MDRRIFDLELNAYAMRTLIKALKYAIMYDEGETFTDVELMHMNATLELMTESFVNNYDGEYLGDKDGEL